MHKLTMSPRKKELLFAGAFHRKALLLALLLHLFVFVAAPTYSIRTVAPKPPLVITVERLPLTDVPRKKTGIPRPREPGPPTSPKTRPHSRFPINPTAYIPHDTRPILIKTVSIDYPETARVAGLEGRVVARLFIGKDGRVKHVVIISGNQIFHDTVREAAFNLLFSPAMMGDQEVGIWASMPFDFSLED